MNTKAAPLALNPSLEQSAYTTARPPDVLWLDRNEGVAPGWLEGIRMNLALDSVSRYPDTEPLRSELAARLSIDSARILITGGGDDAIDRVCRATLSPARTMIIHEPSFEMIERSARLTGAEVETVPWVDGDFPVSTMLNLISKRTGLVALVSPNNPTGRTIPLVAVEAIAKQTHRVGASVLLDLAYIEFAEVNITPHALSLPGVGIVRTFSKAYGLAGLRVGWLTGDAELIERAKAFNSPFPAGGLSLEIAHAALRLAPEWLDHTRSRIQLERRQLIQALSRLGIETLASEANFVCAINDRAGWIHAELLRRGVLVRHWPDRPGWESLLRITCPGDRACFERLLRALRDTILTTKSHG